MGEAVVRGLMSNRSCKSFSYSFQYSVAFTVCYIVAVNEACCCS